jgi:prophage regulatory protein
MEYQNNAQLQIQLMRVKDVARKLSIGVSTVWEYTKSDALFPRPIHLSEKVTAWYEHEIDAFIASKPRTIH